MNLAFFQFTFAALRDCHKPLSHAKHLKEEKGLQEEFEEEMLSYFRRKVKN